MGTEPTWQRDKRGVYTPIKKKHPPAGAPQQPGAPGAPEPAPWAADPILLQAQAAYQQAVGSAQASALAQKQQFLVDFGSPELARSILGLEGEAYATAAEQNPFSRMRQLRGGYERGVGNLNEALNRDNLYYSSERGKQLDLASNLYQGQVAGAGREAQGYLDDIGRSLLGTQQEAQQSLIGAEQEAAQRWLEQALATGGLRAPRRRRRRR